MSKLVLYDAPQRLRYIPFYIMPEQMKTLVAKSEYNKHLESGAMDPSDEDERRSSKTHDAGEDLDAGETKRSLEDCSVDGVGGETANGRDEEDEAGTEADLGQGGDLHNEGGDEGDVSAGAETKQDGEGDEGGVAGIGNP